MSITCRLLQITSFRPCEGIDGIKLVEMQLPRWLNFGSVPQNTVFLKCCILGGLAPNKANEAVAQIMQ